MTRLSLASASLLAPLLALATTALADVVPAPPRSCPEGSHGRTGHAGPWCNPTTCTTDADCRESGTACREAGLCIETQQYQMGGWAGDQQATREIAHGPCGADGQCASGDCRRAKYCMNAGGAPDEGAGEGRGEGRGEGQDGQDEERDEGQDRDRRPREQHPPSAMDPTGMQAPSATDSTGMQSPGAGQQPAGEDEDDGCSASGATHVPAWGLALVALAIGARRRRRRGGH